MDELDWNQTRGFLATAKTGSLSAAARQLGLTQPTLSRQVAALEAALGVTLFERVGKSLVLTESGLDLLEHAEKMGEAATAMSLTASGRSEAVGGLVSISMSDGIAAYLMPRILERIRREAPQIRIAIVASNALSDLQRREADIAIRHVRPEQPALIAKLVRDAEANFYASESWVAKHGRPVAPGDIDEKELLGFGDDNRYAQHLVSLGLPISNNDFPIRSESSMVIWEMVKQGLGVTIMMKDIADITPGVVRILEDIVPVTFPVWIVTHSELHTSKRIRIVFDILADELGRS